MRAKSSLDTSAANCATDFFPGVPSQSTHGRVTKLRPHSLSTVRLRAIEGLTPSTLRFNGDCGLILLGCMVEPSVVTCFVCELRGARIDGLRSEPRREVTGAMFESYRSAASRRFEILLFCLCFLTKKKQGANSRRLVRCSRTRSWSSNWRVWLERSRPQERRSSSIGRARCCCRARMTRWRFVCSRSTWSDCYIKMGGTFSSYGKCFLQLSQQRLLPRGRTRFQLANGPQSLHLA